MKSIELKEEITLRVFFHIGISHWYIISRFMG